jgi:purine-binding chemotaxis protein CheW
MAGACRFCTFYLDELWFGLTAERVQEVLPAPIITLVPLAPHWIAGLVNLRGQIVTSIDLRRRLRLAERPAVVSPEMLVVRREDGLVGLLVTRVDEVVEALKDGFETEPLGQLVTAVCKFPDRLLHVLDLDGVVGDGEEAPFEIAVK